VALGAPDVVLLTHPVGDARVTHLAVASDLVRVLRVRPEGVAAEAAAQVREGVLGCGHGVSILSFAVVVNYAATGVAAL
jgi:hypothetical protein